MISPNPSLRDAASWMAGKKIRSVYLNDGTWFGEMLLKDCIIEFETGMRARLNLLDPEDEVDMSDGLSVEGYDSIERIDDFELIGATVSGVLVSAVIYSFGVILTRDDVPYQRVLCVDVGASLISYCRLYRFSEIEDEKNILLT